MNQSDIVTPAALQHTNEVTCASPWYVLKTKYRPAKATYQPLVNGEEAFRAVHMAVAKASKTIDIICWGFQPSMFFIRDSCTPSIGELLMIKASEGVKVRVLGWEFPLNLAGAAGETNLPGKGKLRILQRELQHTTEDQYAYDKYWYATCAVSGNKAAGHDPRLPVFVGRGFSWQERGEISHWVKYQGLDPDISAKMRYVMKLAPSHHQKTVLVDYQVPDRAVGFVMGHNMLDEYWDTDKHSALNRTENTKPAPNVGPRGKEPRQDISCQLSGPILEHLHHNFATAWFNETGEDLLGPREAKQVGPVLQCAPEVTRQLAQIVRTQPQEKALDIEQLYLKAVNNATRFIYIENQYFRWPPLAKLINEVAERQIKGGVDPGKEGALHLFVITNASDDGMGKGTVKTQRMLETLGRADTMPNVTKLQRIEEVKHNAPPRPRPDLRDQVGQRELKQWQAALDRQIKEINDSTIDVQKRPGLKIHVCSLVAPDSPAGKDWMPVYIHSKLMIIDDVFTTHGSANINSRSMEVDSEINVAHEWASVTERLRRRLWDLHTGGMGVQDDPAVAFKAWGNVIEENRKRQNDKEKAWEPYAPLIEFYYGEKTMADLD
ncbi:phospholipase D-like domain-containing protein [Pseudomonas syringae]|uniref:Phospholipase n=1 Tax=Pseudomonas syringae TaxID=317 RepID=A0A085VH66_PSESX|nr:phospholipase D-like domain-containing protein [Pseudomonas syringae]KFE54779.1 phospholipase [Pseudomonas syringae]